MGIFFAELTHLIEHWTEKYPRQTKNNAVYVSLNIIYIIIHRFVTYCIVRAVLCSAYVNSSGILFSVKLLVRSVYQFAVFFYMRCQFIRTIHKNVTLLRNQSFSPCVRKTSSFFLLMKELWIEVRWIPIECCSLPPILRGYNLWFEFQNKNEF